MINHFLRVRIPQLKALLLIVIYLDPNSVEQRIELVIRCIALHVHSSKYFTEKKKIND